MCCVYAHACALCVCVCSVLKWIDQGMAHEGEGCLCVYARICVCVCACLVVRICTHAWANVFAYKYTYLLMSVCMSSIGVRHACAMPCQCKDRMQHFFLEYAQAICMSVRHLYVLVNIIRMRLCVGTCLCLYLSSWAWAGGIMKTSFSGSGRSSLPLFVCCRLPKTRVVAFSYAALMAIAPFCGSCACGAAERVHDALPFVHVGWADRSGGCTPPATCSLATPAAAPFGAAGPVGARNAGGALVCMVAWFRFEALGAILLGLHSVWHVWAVPVRICVCNASPLSVCDAIAAGSEGLHHPRPAAGCS